MSAREAKIARARELREQGMSYDRIGAELGVTGGCVGKWLNPERTQEYNRRQEARPERKAAKRAWENEHDRPACPRCGAAMGVGADRHGREACWNCWAADSHAARNARRERIASLWNAGAPLRAIAAALESTPNSIGVELVYMRKDGWDVPQRVGGHRAKAAA